MNEETKKNQTNGEEKPTGVSIKSLLDHETVEELLSAKITTGG